MVPHEYGSFKLGLFQNLILESYTIGDAPLQYDLGKKEDVKN